MKKSGFCAPPTVMPFPMAEEVSQSLSSFHPLVAKWFLQQVGTPSLPQQGAWPLMRLGKNVLVSAPTGSGKTLAAFLSSLDALFRQALSHSLKEETSVVYVSPLKALGNDVQKNLLLPLEQLYALAKEEGFSPTPISVWVRSGDTLAKERAEKIKHPPHILITTPESLYLYLTAEKSRATLKQVKTVIVDEIHALAADKRGAHLALSLERLQRVCGEKLQRIGLSATTRPLEAMQGFLTGGRPCECVSAGHVRPWDVRVEIPQDELSAVATHEMWGQAYDSILALAQQHRTILVFTNTRRLAERVAHDLGERLGHEWVSAHHGSMAKELRWEAENKLKAGQLRVMVATASLELGIDIGQVDVVVQMGSPRAISVALQRVGRAGHSLRGVSKGVFFALTRDELVECAALLWAMAEKQLDVIRMPPKPLDVLAQQMVAEIAAEECDEETLWTWVTQAFPYRDLSREEFEHVLNMVSQGVATTRGKARAHVFRDALHKKLKPRKGARLTALMNGGAIADTFTFPVIAAPEDKVVGTLDEDFAIDSMAGDVFLLGSTSWRIQRFTGQAVRVESAQGAAPTVPFWRGEAPSRTDELSRWVGKLREEIAERSNAVSWLEQTLGMSSRAAQSLVNYLHAAKVALGKMPSQTCVVAERFFDEAGGMQLLLHAPLGGRINRAWGMALRKRFCRTFDFELQAAATDDGVLLSLGEQHSFPLEEVFSFLSPKNVEEVLTQAVLQSPLFGTRFRWNASRALALSRMSMGKRVPPPLQRARSDDLLAAVFPAQVGCQDNHGGADIEIPDHPLVKETMSDCLHDAMDIDGLKVVLEAMKSGRIRTHAADVPTPSVLAHALLNSAPYTFLDEAPLEERRARAVSLRRVTSPSDAVSFGALDENAIVQVVEEAAWLVRDAWEVHDALFQCVVLPEKGSVPLDPQFLDTLMREGRAVWFVTEQGTKMWASVERLPALQALFPQVAWTPRTAVFPAKVALTQEEAAVMAVRGWMEVVGPITVNALAKKMALPELWVEQALYSLEASGQVLRGHFSQALADGTLQFCDRRLLQRIHRLTVGKLRKEIEPLSAQDFMRFLFKWHHLEPQEALRGTNGLGKAIRLLQGFEAPVGAWETSLLPSRMKYLPELLERASWSGDVAWGRLSKSGELPKVVGPKRGAVVPQEGSCAQGSSSRVPGKNSSLTFVLRDDLDWMLALARGNAVGVEEALLAGDSVSHAARDVVQVLQQRGASFFPDLVAQSRRLASEVEDALWELVSKGWVTADAVDNLRVLTSPKARRRQREVRRGGPGRWSLLRVQSVWPFEELRDRQARLFLQRYGIVCREVVSRESLALPWRELLPGFRRMEARGEIRGGRFLAGLAGEQFALPEAVDMARSVRRQPKEGRVVKLAAVDPLNLTGIVTPGPRIGALPGKFVIYVEGVPKEENTLSVGSLEGHA